MLWFRSAAYAHRAEAEATEFKGKTAEPRRAGTGDSAPIPKLMLCAASYGATNPNWLKVESKRSLEGSAAKAVSVVPANRKCQVCSLVGTRSTSPATTTAIGAAG